MTELPYLRLSRQAADLDGLGGRWDRVGGLGGAGEASGRGRDRCGDHDAGEWGGASFTARLTVDDADLVDGRR